MTAYVLDTQRKEALQSLYDMQVEISRRNTVVMARAAARIERERLENAR